jgi:hypothetical protein
MKQSIERLFLKIHDKMLVAVLFVSYFVVVGPTAFLVRLVARHKLPASHFPNNSSWTDIPERRGGGDTPYLKPF